MSSHTNAQHSRSGLKYSGQASWSHLMKEVDNGKIPVLVMTSLFAELIHYAVCISLRQACEDAFVFVPLLIRKEGKHVIVLQGAMVQVITCTLPIFGNHYPDSFCACFHCACSADHCAKYLITS